jgi:flagellar basal-body rod protein FlgB
MIDALFNQPTYVAAKKMLDATVLRQEAIASNLVQFGNAQLQAPGRGADFFAGAIEPGGEESATRRKWPDCNRVWRWTSRPFRAASDGNTVTLESEMLKLNQNTFEDALGNAVGRAPR